MSESASATLLRRLGKRVHELRSKQKLTQEALANRCGFSQKFLSELERGSKAPSWETLVKLSRGLGVSLAVLMFSIDDDREHQANDITEIIAGRPAEARYEIVKAVKLILRAAEAKE